MLANNDNTINKKSVIMYLLKKTVLAISIFCALSCVSVNAEIKKFNMVFVPASEKGDENDYKSLIKIVSK